VRGRAFQYWAETTDRYETYPTTRSLASLKGIVKKPAKPVSIIKARGHFSSDEAALKLI